jgi:hypothetical protein
MKEVLATLVLTAALIATVSMRFFLSPKAMNDGRFDVSTLRLAFFIQLLILSLIAYVLMRSTTMRSKISVFVFIACLLGALITSLMLFT